MNEIKVKEKPTLEDLEDNLEKTRNISNSLNDDVITLLGELDMGVDKEDDCKPEQIPTNRFCKSNNKLLDIIDTIQRIKISIVRIKNVVGSSIRPVENKTMEKC